MASDVAEHVAARIYDAIHENVATKADVNALRAEMREIERRIVIRLGAGAVVIAGLLFSALHFWAPQA